MLVLIQVQNEAVALRAEDFAFRWSVEDQLYLAAATFTGLLKQEMIMHFEVI